MDKCWVRIHDMLYGYYSPESLIGQQTRVIPCNTTVNTGEDDEGDCRDHPDRQGWRKEEIAFTNIVYRPHERTAKPPKRESQIRSERRNDCKTEVT